MFDVCNYIDVQCRHRLIILAFITFKALNLKLLKFIGLQYVKVIVNLSSHEKLNFY